MLRSREHSVWFTSPTETWKCCVSMLFHSSRRPWAIMTMKISIIGPGIFLSRFSFLSQCPLLLSLLCFSVLLSSPAFLYLCSLILSFACTLSSQCRIGHGPLCCGTSEFQPCKPDDHSLPAKFYVAWVPREGRHEYVYVQNHTDLCYCCATRHGY